MVEGLDELLGTECGDDPGQAKIELN